MPHRKVENLEKSVFYFPVPGSDTTDEGIYEEISQIVREQVESELVSQVGSISMVAQDVPQKELSASEIDGPLGEGAPLSSSTEGGAHPLNSTQASPSEVASLRPYRPTPPPRSRPGPAIPLGSYGEAVSPIYAVISPKVPPKTPPPKPSRVAQTTLPESPGSKQDMHILDTQPGAWDQRDASSPERSGRFPAEENLLRGDELECALARLRGCIKDAQVRADVLAGKLCAATQTGQAHGESVVRSLYSDELTQKRLDAWKKILGEAKQTVQPLSRCAEVEVNNSQARSEREQVKQALFFVGKLKVALDRHGPLLLRSSDETSRSFLSSFPRSKMIRFFDRKKATEGDAISTESSEDRELVRALDNSIDVCNRVLIRLERLLAESCINGKERDTEVSMPKEQGGISTGNSTFYVSASEDYTTSGAINACLNERVKSESVAQTSLIAVSRLEVPRKALDVSEIGGELTESMASSPGAGGLDIECIDPPELRVYPAAGKAHVSDPMQASLSEVFPKVPPPKPPRTFQHTLAEFSGSKRGTPSWDTQAGDQGDLSSSKKPGMFQAAAVAPSDSLGFVAFYLAQSVGNVWNYVDTLRVAARAKQADGVSLGPSLSSNQLLAQKKLKAWERVLLNIQNFLDDLVEGRERQISGVGEVGDGFIWCLWVDELQEDLGKRSSILLEHGSGTFGSFLGSMGSFFGGKKTVEHGVASMEPSEELKLVENLKQDLEVCKKALKDQEMLCQIHSAKQFFPQSQVK